MPLLPDPIQSAFATGATVVTPNRRLARALISLYDLAQRRAGRAAWPAARALPWDAWLQGRWLDALEAGVTGSLTRLHSPLHAGHSWNRIVDAYAAPLIDARGAASLAAEAWKLAHAWGAGGESWRGWAATADGENDDPAAFARWADDYAALLSSMGAVDGAQLADRLAGWAGQLAASRGARIVLAGFIEFSPQQQRLLAALGSAGAHVERLDALPDGCGRIWRATGLTPRDELARALSWARARALANPDATIGVVVLDLASRRAEVGALADDILCPALQWPGHEEAARPYDLSLGGALADVPLVAAALDLVGLAGAPLPLGRAAALLRTPYLSGAPDAWMRRAQLEVDWLKQGRRTLSVSEATTALNEVDSSLAQRWRQARAAQRLPASASPREWTQAWRSWLDAAGWPGTRALSSNEYQARAAWDDALARFATLAPAVMRLSRADALAALRTQLAAEVFQPESIAPRIQILGVLEAAGLPFDALWIAGLAAESWPPPPRPNPLLPLSWQRERDVPRATAARELAYARALTGQFMRAAGDVVFSHPLHEDDHPHSPSALLPGGSAIDAAVTVGADTAGVQFTGKPALEAIVDRRAPALPWGSRAPGGARLIEAQSDCPFKAVAACRLATEPWAGPIDGLSPLERGTLLHAAFAAFWRDVGDQRTLAALDREALAAKIEAAVAVARGALPPLRWRALSPLIAAGESTRLKKVVEVWIAAHERPRPPFSVQEVEGSAALTLQGLAFRLRLDRVDALAPDGGTVIIDYKSGRTMPPDAWFDARPQAPQLALYALARRAAVPTRPLRAVAYAQLKPGDIKVQGLAADDDAWPGLKLPGDLRRAGLADWPAVEARWAESIGALAAEIAAGEAAVTPRDIGTTCKQCGRQALCRIRARSLRDDNGDGDG